VTVHTAPEASTDQPAAPTLPAEVEALVLAELSKRVKSRTELVKATFSQAYPDGRKETFRSPLPGNPRLGSVWRTDPEPVWRVTDREALHADLRQHDGVMETVHEIADMEAAVAVLLEHAPHLLVEITRVRQGVIDDALAQSAATGVPAAAGVELVKPAGVLTVKVDPKAGDAVERLIGAGLITWDGQRAIQS
jgi:hypothetical protein